MAAPRDRLLPRWMLVAAVLVSGVLTAWAMWESGMTGPQDSWGRVDDAVAQVWAGDGAAPGVAPYAVAGPTPTVSAVARVAGAPPILSGTRRPHGDRGPCTGCHRVMQSSGRPVPLIQSSASLPHAYRGICVNCHSIAGIGPVGPRPVAMPVAPSGFPGQALAPPPGPALAAPAPRPAQPAGPREVEWLGVEAQPGPLGVVVGAADGVAARAGVAAGDLIVSVNGAPTSSMATLADVTQNGNLPQGTMIVRRVGQRLAFELRQGPGAGMQVAPITPGAQAWGTSPRPGPSAPSWAAPTAAQARPEVAF